MAHFTVTIGTDGPAIDLAVAVGEAWQRRLSNQGSPTPPAATIRALIDTGSDRSVVHPQVLERLGVAPTGSVRVRRPGAKEGFRRAPLFDTRLSLGGIRVGGLWIPMHVVGVAPSTPTVLARIGRDLLEHCTFFYNGPGAEVTISC